jgi:hypothetical protein
MLIRALEQLQLPPRRTQVDGTTHQLRMTGIRSHGTRTPDGTKLIYFQKLKYLLSALKPVSRTARSVHT